MHPFQGAQGLLSGRGNGRDWTLDVSRVTDPLRVVVEELEPGRRDEGGVVVEVWTTVFVEAMALSTRE